MSLLKVAHGRTASFSHSSAPSPAASVASISSQNPLKRSRFEVPPATAADASGRSLLNHITFAVEYLQGKETAVPFSAILSYLSLSPNDSLKEVLAVQQILRKHANVEFIPDGAPSPSPSAPAAGTAAGPTPEWNKGMYRFQPKYNIRSSSDLIAYLQAQRSFTGIPVKDLREGWSGAIQVINELEQEHRLLVVRNRKDNQARMIWLGDPTLHKQIDPEFQSMWHKIKVPPEVDLPAMLRKDGHKSTSADPSLDAGNGKAALKAATVLKKPRRAGKTTNTHMLGLLKDYSSRRA